MTTRPTQKNRPNSAIYLGSDPLQLASTPPSIPDLPEPPEPPSPVSSNGSGLPSPPATNSTGSGSTGDPASVALRQKTFSPRKDRAAMLNEQNVKAFHAAFTKEVDDDDDNDLNDEYDEHDEDDTARIVRRQSLKTASEHNSALQRVKSLTERNRLALDKLSSYSRGTPSPKPPSTTLSPPPTASTSAASSSSSSSHTASSSSRPIAHPRPRHSLQESTVADRLSGSETEKESVHFENSHSSSSQSSTKFNRSVTPVTRSTRMRLKSAPASPGKALKSVASSSGSNPSDTSPSRRRSRVSIALRHGDDDVDVTEAALAAVASSRRSPATGRKRQPLPREFLDGGTDLARRESTDGKVGRFSVEPPTPSRHSSLHLSPRHHSQDLRSTGPGKFSTVRDLSKRQSRWMSEDMSSTASYSNLGDDEDVPEDSPSMGRRQSIRGGSAESALTAGRSLVGEGLRAAGIGMKQREVRISGDLFRDRSPEAERSQSRLGGARGTLGQRAATSMAQFRGGGDADEEDEVEPRTAPAHFRTHKSAYTPSQRDREASLARRETLQLERERERAGSSLTRYSSPAVAITSPHHNRRLTPSQGQNDHIRLMSDGLSVFESNVDRLASSSSGLFSSGADILRNAQATVQLAERVNDLLRAMNTRALDEQIRIEIGDVDGGSEVANLWRQVGGDVRDGMRMSDELVRSLTALLLGVGRAMRDVGGGVGEEHRRSVSLDEEGLTRTSLSPESGAGRSGRLSAESRRSWENARDRERSEALQRLTQRPESSMRERPASVLNLLRDREVENKYETPPPKGTIRNGTNAAGSSSMRRLYTPREPTDAAITKASLGGMNSFDSQETILAPEPSPSPAGRQQTRAASSNIERSRTLPPLSIPRPLGTLPSENGHKRNQTTTETPSRDKPARKPSVSTVRGPNLVSTSNAPTTAVTAHTVTHSPVAFPALSRHDSSGPPTAGRATNTIGRSGTAARSSTLSSSALSGLQQQALADQQRARSGSNAELAHSRTGMFSDAESARKPLRSNANGGGNTDTATRVHPADRSAAATTVSAAAKQRERRRTVVDIWPNTGKS